MRPQTLIWDGQLHLFEPYPGFGVVAGECSCGEFIDDRGGATERLRQNVANHFAAVMSRSVPAE